MCHRRIIAVLRININFEIFVQRDRKIYYFEISIYVTLKYKSILTEQIRRVKYTRSNKLKLSDKIWIIYAECNRYGRLEQSKYAGKEADNKSVLNITRALSNFADREFGKQPYCVAAVNFIGLASNIHYDFRGNNFCNSECSTSRGKNNNTNIKIHETRNFMPTIDLILTIGRKFESLWIGKKIIRTFFRDFLAATDQLNDTKRNEKIKSLKFHV